MKKSSFIALIFGSVSIILFALGMCMALIPEWHALLPGIISGILGLVLGLITLLLWRKSQHKKPIHISGKTVFTAAVGTVGALTFGTGMWLCMALENILAGIPAGIAGILLLLCLIPLIKGIKE